MGKLTEYAKMFQIFYLFTPSLFLAFLSYVIILVGKIKAPSIAEFAVKLDHLQEGIVEWPSFTLERFVLAGLWPSPPSVIFYKG